VPLIHVRAEYLGVYVDGAKPYSLLTNDFGILLMPMEIVKTLRAVEVVITDQPLRRWSVIVR